MRTRYASILCLLALLSLPAFGIDLELEKKKSERDIEDRVTTEIRRYFSDLNFLVTADVTLVDLTPPAKKEKGDDRDLLLPGVSGFQAEKPREEEAKPQFGIESIVLKLLIDRNRTKEDKDLLESIAFYTGKLNKVRGDRVDIQEMTFPATAMQMQREQLKAEQDKRIAELEKAKEDAEERAKLAQQPSQVPQQQAKEQPFLNPTTMLLLGLGLLLLILIGVLLSRRKAAQSEVQMMPQQIGGPMAAPQALPSGADGQSGGAQPSTEAMQELSESIEVEKIKTNLIATCAGESELTSNVIRDMVGDPAQRDKLVVIINQLGGNVLQVMRDYFSIEEMQTLQQLTMEKPEKVPAEIRESLLNFQNQLTIKRFSEARNTKQNPFAFLEKLSEPQLYLLMKDEPPGIIAIILSQLATAIASSMLKNLPSMQQGEVALELGKLRRLTSDTYVSVAKQVASKAATIPVINNVQVQGTDMLLDIFDNLDETTEGSIIEFIKVVNLDLYREITGQRVSFAAINQLDERILRQLVKDISGDEMAIALKNAPAEISQRFLSVLPSKARVILEDRMTSLKAVSPDDELKARRRITRMVRQYIKAGGTPMAAAPAEGTAEEEQEAQA